MRFITAHAGHADWQQACAEALAQVDAARARPDTVTRPTLGLLYCTEDYADAAPALLQRLRQHTGVEHWAGAVGVGIAADATEYWRQPALALMLLQLHARDFRVFHGHQPLPPASRSWRGADSALLHVDPTLPELDELVADMAARTGSGRLFGAVCGGEQPWQLADGVWQGGLSGVGFSSRVNLISGITQGWSAVGPLRTITACREQLIEALDGQDALRVLLDDLGEAELDLPRLVPQLRSTLAGLAPTPSAGSRVDHALRHLIGIDSGNQALAIAGVAEPGMRLQFCRRDAQAARRDLVRLCSELRDELEQRRDARRQQLAAAAPASSGPLARGAVYMSCVGRGGPHFGGASAELALLRRQLGEVPLVGVFGAGEIFGARRYSYSGVLSVFGADPEM